MKKFWIALLALSVLTLTACGGSADVLDLIGIPSAKALALEDAGLTDSSVRDLQVEEGARSGIKFYTVSFLADDKSYVYDNSCKVS